MDLDIKGRHKRNRKELQKMEKLISINLMHLFVENKMKTLRKTLLFTQPKILLEMNYPNKLTLTNRKIKILRIKNKNLLKIKIIIKIKKVF
jgi:hypothetical protein